MSEATQTKFDRAIDKLDAAILRTETNITTRLDKLNDRTRALETKMAVQWLLWCLVGAILLPLVPEIYRIIVH